MDKTFYEFDDGVKLYNRLKFWSNAAGELHHYGQYDLNDASELPKELQRAYDELWNVGSRCLEYLVEFDEKYYVALISEFCRFFAEDEKISMEELYKLAKQNALELYHQDLFKDTILIIGKETGLNECHEVIFLVPAIELRRVYREIEDAINQNIWEINRGPAVEQRKVLAFVIEEKSKIKCNSEDGSCKLLGLFNTKYEADQAYKRKYGSLDTYDGFKGHYIKYVPLPKEGEVVDIEVANWLYIPR